MEGDDILQKQLEINEEDREKIVNGILDPKLIKPMLDFMYMDEHEESVPPVLQLSNSIHDQKEKNSVYTYFYK